MTLDAFIDWLHARGISMTTLLEAISIWNRLPDQDRKQLLQADRIKPPFNDST